jgi:hypothetical protein
MGVPFTFAGQAGPIPLADLDADFAAIAAGTVPFTQLVVGPPPSGVALTVNGVTSTAAGVTLSPTQVINGSTNPVSNANPLLNNDLIINVQTPVNGGGGMLLQTVPLGGAIFQNATYTAKNNQNNASSFAEINAQGGPGTDNVTMLMTNSTWAANGLGVAGLPAGQCGVIGGVSGTVGVVPVALISAGKVQAFINASGFTVAPTVAPAAGGSAACGILASSTASLGIFFGTGAPTFAAAQGSIYRNTTGAAGARLYVNTNGGTTWAPAASP